MLQTENLVILFTDIAGFTEATSLHSREQNQRILDNHNSILLPIVKRFHGRHIKSVGDAFLLAFTSPTDAMRCAMAMQDALHEYNRTAPSGEEIHIRIAASLGEVRVTKDDIFGEPVNVTSRIESITPADEIYFSEAVYLAMNKAEVPALEVGLQELKGIPKPVRIFSIPRFANNKLVPEASIPVEVDHQIGFPFGGMHLSAVPVAMPWTSRIQKGGLKGLRNRSFLIYGLGTGAIALIAIIAAQFTNVSVKVGAPDADAHTALPPSAPTPTPETIAAPPTSVPTSPPVASVAAPVPSFAASIVKSEPPKPSISNIMQAKRAYRGGRISKERYRDIARRLEDELDLYLRRAKIDYNEGRISKQMYRSRVETLKRRYIGE